MERQHAVSRISVKWGRRWPAEAVSARLLHPRLSSNAKTSVCLVSGQAGRGVPDIAMSARNYLVGVDSCEVRWGAGAVGRPWAALIARLNQAKGKNVGFLNPFLYANATNSRGRRRYGRDERHMNTLQD